MYLLRGQAFANPPWMEDWRVFLNHVQQTTENAEDRTFISHFILHNPITLNGQLVESMALGSTWFEFQPSNELNDLDT